MSRKRHTPADERHFVIRSLATDMADGRSIAPHAHSWHQLIYASAGVMTVWTHDGSWVAPPHWAIWAPAGVPHGIRFTGPSSMRTLYLRPGAWKELPERCAVIAVPGLLRALILRAVEIGMLDRRDPVHRAMATLIADAIRAGPARALDLPSPSSAALRAVASAAVDEAGERASAAALAARFGIGARTLERRFAEETGMTFGRWRRQARFLQALRGLAAGASVKQAAREAGYKSASAFVAAFGKAFGETPGRYFAAGAADGVAERAG